MAQHDYVIDNASGATVRADINSALSAIQTLNSGTSAPSSTAAGMLWLDTTGGAPYVLKVRDAGNNHWLTLGNVTDPGADGNLELLPGKINLPSSGGIYESDGSTEILTESSGAVSLKNTTIDPTATFPAGMIIKKSLITYAEQSGSAIETSSTSYTDTGVGGSFTVKKDSSSSYLKFILEQGMTHVDTGATHGETDFCLTTSNNTSHSNDNSLYGSLQFKNYTRYVGGLWYGRYSTFAIFNVGTRVTTNLTSYSAGDTLYIRMFIKSGNASYTHTFAHDNSHYMLTVEEISK